MQVERGEFYAPDEILRAVRSKVQRASALGEAIDYLTFVPDGEPTLDNNLGSEIELLKSLDTRIAVITNASLAWRTDVRRDLLKADWVSLKVDSTREETWRRINRPHRTLELASILEGIMEFGRAYRGELAVETMLVRGLNDSTEHMEEVAGFLSQLKPDKAYLAIPTRPPAESWVQPPNEQVLNRAYQILAESVDNVEYLIGYEGNEFAFTGDVEEDILSITAVHPMREEAVRRLLARAKRDWPLIRRLIDQGKITETEYRGKRFYTRTLPRVQA
jgi:wyosine [tRNA(Phe)-imidazoG37] synthetase (radical SAM superfamily)